VLKGPFHAVVDKSAFRMDIYADQTDAYGNRIYIRSFPVGLGEFGTTPVGTWVVKPNSKVINPSWVNPRTGEKFDKNDPDIPIGEYWIALEGTDPETELMAGYGIHGTNQPESIGMEMSMGCVRMLADDVRLVYELLVGGKSTVRIVD
jgi:lipoprotein-anchoring transpeptidase ErfK/SrfK